MVEQQKQQGKGRPAGSDASESNVAQANALVVEEPVRRTGGNWPYQVGPLTEVIPAPIERAKKLVRVALILFDDDEKNISQQVVKLVTDAIADCPKGEMAAFRTEGKLRCERLKQFSEMLTNEFIYQTATLK